MCTSSGTGPPSRWRCASRTVACTSTRCPGKAGERFPGVAETRGEVKQPQFLKTGAMRPMRPTLDRLMESLRARTNRTVVALVLTAALVAGGAVTLLAQSQDDVVAWVNGEPITRDELYEEMVRYVGTQVLDEMILIKLVRQQAAQRGVEVSEDDVAAQLAAIEEDVGGPEQLKSVLQMYNMTYDDLKQQVNLNLLLRALVAPEIEVTEDEIRSYFDENRERLGQPEQVRARHILVETEEQAKELKERLEAGEDFAALAKEHSIDRGSAARGGDLGWFGRGVMVEPFEKAAFSLKPGEVSDPVQTDFGYHLILVEERREAREAVLDEETRSAIEEQLREEKLSQRIPEWLDELRSKADVEIRLGR
ncbi:MAG: foldase [Bacillota bacterium]|nr:foldase [Bacillota bacterium]REJ37582.1 MAG: foldase [Bacillota bacterium]